MFGRKAQIGLFILIGFVLVGTFFAVNFLSTKSITETLPADAQKIYSDTIRSGSVKYLVTGCLDSATKDGLRLLGAQGGNIYTYQNGTSQVDNANSIAIGCPIAGMKGCRVAYGITMPALMEGTQYPPPPNYPGRNQEPFLDFNSWGNFGGYVLRGLCDYYGANRPWAITTNVTVTNKWEGTLERYFTPICLNNIYEKDRSSQQQLEYFIEQKLESCVDWEWFRNNTGFNVTAQKANVTVRFGPYDVYVSANFPLDIMYGGKEPVLKQELFETRVPVRIKTLAELASFISTYDSYRLGFNLSRDYYLLGGDDKITLSTKTVMRSDNRFDEIIILEDAASRIENSPYIYAFVRENRIPALNYIGYESPEDDYDLGILEGKELIINPKAYDPDEDRLMYIYYGWKETYDASFDFETKTVTNYTDKKVRNWSTSLMFNNSLRNASYLTNKSDIGKHIITVFACDEFFPNEKVMESLEKKTTIGGRTYITVNDTELLKDLTTSPLCDWQDVRVMVFDIPFLNAKGDNLFDDIPNMFASIEDPYVLDPSGTHSIYTPFTQLLWNDTFDPFFFVQDYLQDKPNQLFYLPNEEYNITTIANIDIADDKSFKKVGMHEINFTVNVPSAPIISFPVDVKQCLPHYNEDHPFPYPYHNYDANLEEYDDDRCDPTDSSCDINVLSANKYLGDEEVYQASHVCCNEGAKRYFQLTYKKCNDSDSDINNHCRPINLVHNLGNLSKFFNIKITHAKTKNVMFERKVGGTSTEGYTDKSEDFGIEVNNIDESKLKLNCIFPLVCINPMSVGGAEDSLPLLNKDGNRCTTMFCGLGTTDYFFSSSQFEITFKETRRSMDLLIEVENVADDTNQKWGTYASANKECFGSEPFNSSLIKAQDEMNEFLEGGATIDSYKLYNVEDKITATTGNFDHYYENSNSDMGYEYLNDIFESTFARLCGTGGFNPYAERGNVCLGDFQLSSTQVTTCPDKKEDEKETCSGSNADGTACMTYEWPNTFETEMFKAGLLTLPSINGACAEAKPEESFCHVNDGNPVIYFDKGCGKLPSTEGPCGLPLYYEDNEDANLTENLGESKPQHACDYWSGCEDANIITKETFDKTAECNIKCTHDSSGFKTTALTEKGCTKDGGCAFTDDGSPSDIDFSSWTPEKQIDFEDKCKASCPSCDIEILPPDTTNDCKSDECQEGKSDVFCGDDDEEAIGYKFTGNSMTLEPAVCCDGKDKDKKITFKYGECVQGTTCLETPSPKIGSKQTSETGPDKCNDGVDNDCKDGYDSKDNSCQEEIVDCVHGTNPLFDCPNDANKVMCGTHSGNTFCGVNTSQLLFKNDYIPHDTAVTFNFNCDLTTGLCGCNEKTFRKTDGWISSMSGLTFYVCIMPGGTIDVPKKYIIVDEFNNLGLSSLINSETAIFSSSAIADKSLNPTSLGILTHEDIGGEFIVLKIQT